MIPRNQTPGTNAMNAANAFFRNAEVFFKQVPRGLDEAARFTIARRGPLSAAVTNLSLAVELYLKAVALLTVGKHRETHNLPELFDALPPFVQNAIESEYNRRMAAVPAEGEATALEMLITPTPDEPTEQQIAELKAGQPTGTDIRSVLTAEKDAFRNWRYLFESDKPGKATLLRVDYGRLIAIAKSIQSGVRGYHAAPGST